MRLGLALPFLQPDGNGPAGSSLADNARLIDNSSDSFSEG